MSLLPTDVRHFNIAIDSTLNSIPLTDDNINKQVVRSKNRIKSMIEGYDIGIITSLEWPLFNINSEITLCETSVYRISVSNDDFCDVRVKMMTPGKFQVMYMVSGLPLSSTATMKITSPQIENFEYIEHDSGGFILRNLEMESEYLFNEDLSKNMDVVRCSRGDQTHLITAAGAVRSEILEDFIIYENFILFSTPKNSAAGFLAYDVSDDTFFAMRLNATPTSLNKKTSSNPGAIKNINGQSSIPITLNTISNATDSLVSNLIINNTEIVNHLYFYNGIADQRILECGDRSILHYSTRAHLLPGFKI